jgi:predicted dinucleotide-binding enzyme
MRSAVAMETERERHVKAYADTMARALETQAEAEELRALAASYDDCDDARREAEILHRRRLAETCRETAATWRRVARGGR